MAAYFITTGSFSAYDKRGNLVLEQYIKGKKITDAGTYTFDETNRMVEGVNGQAEKSIYAYNGLGALMENTWIIAKNGYGYHDVDADLSAQLVLAANNGNNNGKGNGNKDKPSGSDVKKTSTVVKQFVVDFSRPDFKALQEHEVNGLDYRYVNSDKARLSVVVQDIENGSASLLDSKGELHAYYHTDYLGTTDYLTSAVNSKVISWTNYNEWGEITHNAVLKCGVRELDLVKEYATHDYDAVLQMYYAKARMYDAYNRRFTAVDPILDGSKYDLRRGVKAPVLLVQYLYVANNPIINLDLDGLEFKAYVLKKENKKYQQVRMATFYDTKFAGENLFNIKEIAMLINNTNGFSAGLKTPNNFQNNFGLSVNGPKSLNDSFEVSVKELEKWGLQYKFFGRAIVMTPVSAASGATLAFQYYKCMDGTHRVYMSIANIASYMDRVIVVENQNNKAKLESRTVTAVGLDAALAIPGLKRVVHDAGFIWDGTGKFGYLYAQSGGAGSPTAGLSAFVATFYTNSIDNVAGVGFTVGASGSVPTPIGQLGAGYDYTESIDGGGVRGLIWSASYSAIPKPPSGEAHVQFGVTVIKEAGLSAMLRYLVGNGNGANGGIFGNY